jgi:hypothetical protein
MEDAVLDFLRPPFVPEIFTQIAAGPADDGQFVAVFVVAARAFPFVVVVEDDFAVKAAFMAVVQFGIEFAVRDVVVDVLDHGQDGRDIMGHVGDFGIADAAACRFVFKVGFKGELVEDVDRFADVDVIAVGIVAFVGDVGDGAEAGLVDFAEEVGQVFCRRTVEGEADVRFLPPLLNVGVEVVHDAHGEFPAFRRRVRAVLGQYRRFVDADVAQGQGRIAAVDEFFNGFAGLQAGNGAVLPVDRRYVGRDALEEVDAQEQGFFAEFQALVEDLEEFFFVAVGEDADLRQVEGDDAHVEAAVELVVALFIFPGAEEGAAAHGAEDVAFIGFAHLLGRNIVGIHAFRRTFSGQLGQIEVRAAFADVVFVQDVNEFREGRRDVDVGFVLDALDALAQQFFVDEGRFPGVFVIRLEIHEERDERCLAVGRHEGVDLVLDGLDAVLDFLLRPLPGDFFGLFHIRFDAVDFALFFDDGFHVLLEGLADVRCQDAVDAVDGLAAVLAAGDLGDDLRRHRAGDLEGFRRIDFLAVDDRTIGQHVFQVDETAVEHGLNDVVHVVEMDGAAVVGLDDVGRDQFAAGNVLGHFAGDEVALRRYDVAVLIGVFVEDFQVGVVQQAKDIVVGRIGLALEGLDGLVVFVSPGRGRIVVFQQTVVDLVFDGVNGQVLLDGSSIRFDFTGNLGSLPFFVNTAAAVHGLFNRYGDLISIEGHSFSIALDYF